MFGLGLWEIVVVAVAAVVLIRPQDVPKVLRRLGRAYGTLSRLNESALQTARELESEINRLETARAPGGAGRPTAEASKSGVGRATREPARAAELYRSLRQEDGEDSPGLKRAEGKGKTGTRRTRTTKPKLDGQGGSDIL